MVRRTTAPRLRAVHPVDQLRRADPTDPAPAPTSRSVRSGRAGSSSLRDAVLCAVDEQGSLQPVLRLWSSRGRTGRSGRPGFVFRSQGRLLVGPAAVAVLWVSIGTGMVRTG